MVKHLSAAGVEQPRIAAAVGCSHPTLRKNYAQELLVSKTEVTAMAQSALFTAIKKGEAWAVCFWLKTREGWREVQNIELSGSVDIGIAAELRAAREARLRALPEPTPITRNA